VTISSGSRMLVRLMRAFHRHSRSMYVDIFWSCDGVRTAGSDRVLSAPERTTPVSTILESSCITIGVTRKGSNSSAMRAVFMAADSRFQGDLRF
jgi:hypothetical protein